MYLGEDKEEEKEGNIGKLNLTIGAICHKEKQRVKSQ